MEEENMVGRMGSTTVVSLDYSVYAAGVLLGFLHLLFSGRPCTFYGLEYFEWGGEAGQVQSERTF